MAKMNKKNSQRKPVSHVLRKAIKESGRTAYATAKKAGVSVDAAQRFIKDERGLTLETVDKLAGSLELTLCEDEAPKEVDKST
jgi:plasmid maintenance system antidote protein VapI